MFLQVAILYSNGAVSHGIRRHPQPRALSETNLPRLRSKLSGWAASEKHSQVNGAGHDKSII